MFENVKGFLLRFKFEIVIFVCYFLFLLYLRANIPFYYVLWSLGYDSDNEYYYMMAQDITSIFDGKIMEPFCYRILTPFLVYMLPFKIEVGFTIIALISYFLLGILLYFTLRIHFNKNYSLLGLILFIVFIEYTYDFLIAEFWAVTMIDPLSYLFFVCCFYAILKKKHILYGVFLLLGVLTKENVLFTIPVFFIYNYNFEYQRFKIGNMRNSFLLKINYILPAIFSFILVRLIVNPLPISENPMWHLFYNHTEYISLDFFVMMIKRELSLFKSNGLYFYTFGVWSVLPIFCCFNKIEDVWKFCKLYGIFMCFVYLQLIIAFSRTRLLYIAYYPIIYLSVLGIKQVFDLLVNHLQKSNDQIFIIGYHKKKKFQIESLIISIFLTVLIIHFYFTKMIYRPM